MTTYDEILKTVIGACEFGIDSKRPISTITLNASVSGTGTGHKLSDDFPDETMSIGGSVSQVWTRKPFPPPGLGLVAVDSPGDGFFYLIDFGCGCCTCRSAYVFDGGGVPLKDSDETYTFIFADDTSNDTYYVGASANVAIPLTGTSDFDPMPTLSPVSANLLFWNHKAPPCRKFDGPLPAPLYLGNGNPPLKLFGRIGYPTTFPAFSGPLPSLTGYTITVSGDHDVEAYTFNDSGGFALPFDGWARFDSPTPCSNSDTYEVEIDYTFSYSNPVIDDDPDPATAEIDVSTILSLTIA